MYFKKLFFPFLIVSMVILAGACSTGLGDEVDVEAPVLTIETPGRNQYTPKNITFTGKCSDNKRVEKVELSEVTNINGVSTKKFLCNAVINYAENTWAAELNLEEGEKTIYCAAIDKVNNTSLNSYQQITILVDETAPEGLAWYIDRGNSKQTVLQDKQFLENLDLNISSSVDYPQNVSFTVHGSIYDAMSVETVRLSILDEDGNEILDSVEKTSESGLYSPEFYVTHEQLVAQKPALASGKHYLQLQYYSKDHKGNEAKRDIGWFIWYPESDIPNYDREILDKDTQTVLAPVNSSVTLGLFDDDELEYVYAGLIDETKFKEISGSEVSDKENTLKGYSESQLVSLGLIKTVVSGSQISSVSADTGGNPGDFYLAAFAQDNTEKHVKKAFLIPALISDDNFPILFIEKPTENTIPKINEGETSGFTVEGYCLDTKRTESLKVAFIPAGAYDTNAEKRNAAQEILKNDNTAVGSFTLKKDGTKIWNLKLEDDGTMSSNSSNADKTTWKKQNFTLKLDLLSDFMFNGEPDVSNEYKLENLNKFFEFQVTDDDGNVVYQDYKLEGDTSEPDIKPDLEDMYVCDYTEEEIKTNGFTIGFTASKETGLGLDVNSYKITRVKADNTEEALVEKGNRYTYTQDQLKSFAESESQLKFRYYAMDLLKNSAVAQRTVVLTALPALKTISTDSNDGTYKLDDVISIYATFSSPVKVQGVPKLIIKYSEADTTPKYASYESGSGTDTLKFAFKVPRGAKSSKLYCPNVPVILNGGKIETTDTNGGNAHLDTLKECENLQDSKTIALDGIQPELESVYVKCDEKIEASVSTGKEINVIVYATENILVSGNPVLKLHAGDAVIDCSFQGINEKQIFFSHKVTAEDTNATIGYNLADCFIDSDLKFITDKCGNTLLSGEDITTATKIKIDTTAPLSPVLAMAPGTLRDGASYNKKQTLTLIGIETGGTAFYSLDGGLSFSKYTEPVVLDTGSYKLTAKQQDAAENTSPNANIVSITIDTLFPEVSDFVCEVPDGVYPEGSVLRFKLSFDDKVKTTGTGASLTLFSKNSGKTAKLESQTTGSSSLSFVYTVNSGDDYSGLTVVSADLTNVQDIYGNTPSATACDAILEANGSRPGIIIDAVQPILSSFVPGGKLNRPTVIATNGNVITLTFNEDVYKESGKLTLRRKGNWLIPVVLTETEFNSVYNNTTSKEVLMITENGSAKLHSQTGLPIGPYIKTTHGLKLENGKYVPDTDTKYVLDFRLGNGSGTDNSVTLNDGTVVTVADIRSAFEAAGFHKQVLDVTSNSVVVSGNVVTITFPEELVDGREWEFVAEEGCFRDAVGNKTEAITDSFWSAKVAKPVVRVDRYSHGWGASEPGATGTLTNITAYGTAYNTNNSGAKIAPTGYVRVRVDCETPGSSVYTKKIENLTYTDNVTGTSTLQMAGTAFNPAASDLEDSFTAVNTGNGANLYSGFIIAGDGQLNSSRRDYITAFASKTDFDDSENGFEGIFKTVVIHYESGGKDIITIEGGTAAGGMPIYSGFPLRDATLDKRYGKNAYTPQSGTNNKKVWYWHSYEIVSQFSEMGKVGNYTQNYYSTSYGLTTHIYNVAWY